MTAIEGPPIHLPPIRPGALHKRLGPGPGGPPGGRSPAGLRAPSANTNIVVGVLGAVVGGFMARTLFADVSANNGLVASFGVALVGACVLIAAWKLFAPKLA